MVKRQGDKYREELAITRAKLFLDQISITLKVVPEYPDMLEDNREMAILIEEKDLQIGSQKELKDSYEKQIAQLKD